MGLVPTSASRTSCRVVGTASALDLLLTGRLVGAEEALALGLVSRVEEDVVAAAVETAGMLVVMPPWALATTKSNVYRAMESTWWAKAEEEDGAGRGPARLGVP